MNFETAIKILITHDGQGIKAKEEALRYLLKVASEKIEFEKENNPSNLTS